MFVKILKMLALVAFFAVVTTGSFLFATGGSESYLCDATRFSKKTVSILLIPLGFCDIVDSNNPRNLLPPPILKTAEDSVYFRSDKPHEEYPNKITILIQSGCVFESEKDRLKSNTYVTWVNMDDKPHGLKIDRSDTTGVAVFEMSSESIPPNEEYKMFINQYGVFSYRCEDIPSSKGTFSVVGG